MSTEKKNIDLTPAQNQIASNLATHVLATEKFALNAEEDLKDGLSGTETIELVLQSPTLVVAVKGILAERKLLRKETSEVQAAIFVKIGEIVGTDHAGATQRVSLVFDYVTKMVGVVTTTINETKKFAAAMRGEAPKTRKPRTPKA